MIKGIRKNKTIYIIIAIIAIALFGLMFIFRQTNKHNYQLEQVGSFTNFTSSDLKISFNYPREWYVDDKNLSILLTSYKTFIGENKKPGENQLRVDIDPVSLCQSTIDQNLIYGGCGENQKILNKILSKEVKQTPFGTFYKYMVQYPDNSEKTIYYLQSSDKILQISKSPDSSQFEEEFNQIVNSIRFL